MAFYSDIEGEFNVFTFDNNSGFLLKSCKETRFIEPRETILFKTGLTFRPISPSGRSIHEYEAVVFPSVHSHEDLKTEVTRHAIGEELVLKLTNRSSKDCFHFNNGVIGHVFVLRKSEYDDLRCRKRTFKFFTKNDVRITSISKVVRCIKTLKCIDTADLSNSQILWDCGSTINEVESSEYVYTKYMPNYFNDQFDVVVRTNPSICSDREYEILKNEAVTDYKVLEVDITGAWCLVQSTFGNKVNVLVDYFGYLKDARALLNRRFITIKSTDTKPQAITPIKYQGASMMLLGNESVYYDTTLAFISDPDTIDPICGCFIFNRKNDTPKALYCPPEFYSDGEKVIIIIKNTQNEPLHLIKGLELGAIMPINVMYMKIILNLPPFDEIKTRGLELDPSREIVTHSNICEIPLKPMQEINAVVNNTEVDVIVSHLSYPTVQCTLIDITKPITAIQSPRHFESQKSIMARLMKMNPSDNGHFVKYTNAKAIHACPDRCIVRSAKNAETLGCSACASHPLHVHIHEDPYGVHIQSPQNHVLVPGVRATIETPCFLSHTPPPNLVCLVMASPMAASAGIYVKPEIYKEFGEHIWLELINQTKYHINTRGLLLGHVVLINAADAERIINNDSQAQPPIYTGDKSITATIVPHVNLKASPNVPFNVKSEAMNLQGPGHRALVGMTHKEDSLQVIPCILPTNGTTMRPVLSAVLLQEFPSSAGKSIVSLINIGFKTNDAPSADSSMELLTINHNSVLFKETPHNKQYKLAGIEQLIINSKAKYPINAVYPEDSPDEKQIISYDDSDSEDESDIEIDPPTPHPDAVDAESIMNTSSESFTVLSYCNNDQVESTPTEPESSYPYSSITDTSQIRRVNHRDNAGVDIKNGKDYTIPAHGSTVIIPRIKMILPAFTFGLIMGRSSAGNLGLLVPPTAIYENEDTQFEVVVKNLGNEDVTIKADESIMQYIVCPLREGNPINLFLSNESVETVVAKHGKQFQSSTGYNHVTIPSSFRGKYKVASHLPGPNPPTSVGLMVGTPFAKSCGLVVFPGVLDSNYDGPVYATIYNPRDAVVSTNLLNLVKKMDIPILPAYMWERVTDEEFVYVDNRGVLPYTYMDRNYLITRQFYPVVDNEPINDESVNVIKNKYDLEYDIGRCDPFYGYSFYENRRLCESRRKKAYKRNHRPYSRIPVDCKFIPHLLSDRGDQSFGSSGK